MRIVSFLLFPIFLFAEHSLVLVHIGENIPDYTYDAIEQAHLFNPDCPIYMLSNKKAFAIFSHPDIHPVFLEDLEPTPHHKKFSEACPHQGLFRFSLERFFYIEEFLLASGQKNVFHIENDVMLYCDLEELLPTFEAFYPGLAAVFDSDFRAIPGFVFVSSAAPLGNFVKFAAEHAAVGHFDMEMFALYQKSVNRSQIDHLPLIHRSYREDYPLVNALGQTAATPSAYSRHLYHFNSIFDAAAIGQYLGGMDPLHQIPGTGFINERCVFDPSKLAFTWEKDAKGRKIPFAQYKKEKYRINNLHVHCKNLKTFLSKD